MIIQDVLPRDAIPSIDDPSFGSAYIGDEDDDVIVVESDAPRTYPVRILSYHEIVNDVFGRFRESETFIPPLRDTTEDKLSIAVTGCPICPSGVVYLEEIAAHTAANALMDLSDGGLGTIEAYSEHLELVEIRVTANSPGANKQFDEIGFPRGSVVIQRSDSEELPGDETVLEPGIQYLVPAKPHFLDDLIRLMRE